MEEWSLRWTADFPTLKYISKKVALDYLKNTSLKETQNVWPGPPGSCSNLGQQSEVAQLVFVSRGICNNTNCAKLKIHWTEGFKGGQTCSRGLTYCGHTALENMSYMVIMMLYPCDGGSPGTKSKGICDQGHLGVESGLCSGTACACRNIFTRIFF